MTAHHESPFDPPISDVPEGYKIPDDWWWNNVKYPWVIDATGETVKFPVVPLVPEGE